MSTPSPTLQGWGEWVASLSLAAIPPAVLERARLQRAAVLASCAAGLHGADVPPALVGARALGRGTAIAPPGLRGLSTAGAIAAGAVLSVALDYDDYLFMAHPGHSSVQAALQAGAEVEASGDDTLVAQVAANELAGRLGAACLLGPQNGQAWSFLHRLSAAAATARVRCLGGAETAHALALALLQPEAARWHGLTTGGKMVLAADPAVAGYRAARMAAMGLQGPLDALDHPFGFFGTFSFQPLRGYLHGLGSAWVTASLGVKPQPGCAYLLPALEALGDTLDEAAAGFGRPVTAEDVRSIHVATSLPGAEMERLLGGAPRSLARLDPVAVNFSIARSLALRVVRGHLHARDLALPALAEVGGEVADLAQRIDVRHDWRSTFGLLDALADGAGLGAALADIPVGEWPRIARRAREAWGDGLALQELPRALVALPSGLRNRALASLALRLVALPESVFEASQTAFTAASSLLGRASHWLRTGLLEPTSGPRAEAEPETPAWRFADMDLAALRMPFPTRVELFLTDGRVLRGERDHHRGAPGCGLPELEAVTRERWDEHIGALATPHRTAALWEQAGPRGWDPNPAELLGSIADACGSHPRGRPPDWLRRLG